MSAALATVIQHSALFTFQLFECNKSHCTSFMLSVISHKCSRQLNKYLTVGYYKMLAIISTALSRFTPMCYVLYNTDISRECVQRQNSSTRKMPSVSVPACSGSSASRNGQDHSVKETNAAVSWNILLKEPSHSARSTLVTIIQNALINRDTGQL